MFEESFNTTLDRYRALLSDEAAGHLELINDNFDTGGMTGPGKYRMNDEAHAKLLGKLAEQKFAGASPEVREELLHFLFRAGRSLCYKTQRQGLGQSAGAARAVEGRTPVRSFAVAPTGEHTFPR